MKLTELKPKWMQHEGQNVAIIFLCPDCVRGICKQKPLTWLTCTFVALGHKEQAAMIEDVIARYPEDFKATDTEEHDVVHCEKLAWERSVKILEEISITPSLDASRAGHWHGHVTNGEIR